MTYNVFTYNNYVGILTDAIIIKNIILKFNKNVNIIFIDTLDINYKSDVGIWIQNFNLACLDNFKMNIFFINEEWVGEHELNNLHRFNYVVCKSKYAQNLLKPYCNAVCLPFISPNYYDNNIVKFNKMLHFMGRSIQKNTELILQQTVPITLIDPDNRYSPNLNFSHINRYQTKDELINLLNSHNIHLCVSLYESWGHYFYEGLSTGAEMICSDIPAFTENIDTSLVHVLKTKISKNYNYVFDADNHDCRFGLRQSFYVDPIEFKNKLTTFEPIGKELERRTMYSDLMHTNENKLKNFFLQFE